MASTSYATHSSQSIRKLTYDVFLSFRGEDTRKNFVDHLYDRLKLKGIHTFRDDEQLERGQCIAPTLLQAIQESRFAVVVFSKHYASSAWCLDEVAKIMECKEKNDQIVVPIFYDVEPSHVRKQTGCFEESFAKHQENFKDDDEGTTKVERWKKALTEAGNIVGHDLHGDKYNGFELDCIKTVVNDIFKQLWPAPSIPETSVGLESPLKDINSLMEGRLEDVKLIGIWGMGGIGKTTIARAAFAKFSSRFDGECFLADIREKHSKHGMGALQQKLLSKLVNENTMHIVDEDEGTKMIKEKLKSKRVLIVLDDVDKQDQLDKLVGDGKWLCHGSRLIITTRDRHLFCKFGVVVECYEVKKLDEEKALKLFSLHAFKNEFPDKGFEHLSKDFVTYAGGLPLALKLWGSFVCGRKEKEWNSTLEKIKDIPDDKLKVISQLKISFDGLDDGVKKIFLDISCFFRKESRDYVEDVLKICGSHPGIGIPVLIERCLLFERDGDIDMHDLIQEMGWHIATQENVRSRVWQLKDAYDVLSGKMEPKAVEGLSLSFTDRSYDENISPSIEAFKQMTKLKMLMVNYGIYGFESLESFWMSIMDYIPRSLTVLIFSCYPWPKLFCTKDLKNLTYLDLSSSRYLLKTPNFVEMPNLERLYLSSCERLKEIHPSVGNLTKLISLDLSRCSNLEKLPSFNQVSSLKFLYLERCRKLENFPEIKEMKNLTSLDLRFSSSLLVTPNFDKMSNLKRLKLSDCKKLKEIHPSVGNLKNLVLLDLRRCSNLEKLPNFNQVSSLKSLKLSFCQKLKYFPEIKASTPYLVELDLKGVGIIELPSSIQLLHGLTKLHLDKCEHLVRLCNGICELENLKVLKITWCSNIDSLPENLGCLILLEYLNLRGSDFSDLPESLSQLPHLQYLDITSCRRLKALPELPESIEELYADCSFAVGRNIPKLAIKFSKLYSVSFSYCDQFDRYKYLSFLAKEFIHFPFHRNTPFNVSYESNEKSITKMETYVLRSFKYRRYKSNGISINFNRPWYSQNFVGFVVCFLSWEGNMWGTHSYQDIGDHAQHCVIIVKLSHEDNGNKVIQTECVIGRSSKLYEQHICFAYIPFSCLWPGSKTMIGGVTPNDYSRLEVAFKGLDVSAYYWGCNLLYEREENQARQGSSSLQGSNTNIGALTKLEYLNLSGIPKDISRLRRLQFLDISSCRRLKELPKLPANIRELYAYYRLASHSNIAELATKYLKLYSVSFSDGDVTFPAGELAKNFIPITEPFLKRNTPFLVTYPACIKTTINFIRCFEYTSSAHSEKISIHLNPAWYSQNFVGFVLCFLFSGRERWESDPDIRLFRHCEVIVKLAHKDNGNEVLQTKCVVGRLYDEEFNFFFGGQHQRLVCFAYIPFSSLWPESKTITDDVTPNHYSVFEAAIQDSKVSTNWSCGLLYIEDELLIEAIRRKREQEQIGFDGTDLEHRAVEAPMAEHNTEEIPMVEKEYCRCTIV